MPSPSKIKDYTLREYQTEIVARIHASWKEGKRSVMCQMPTGTGKTVVAVSIIRDWLEEHTENCKGQIVVVAHRREILEQINETLRNHGIEDVMENGIVLVESIQKLSRDIADSIIDLQPELVIVDEAHHAKAATYSLLWKTWSSALFVGMTATPSRLKQEGFTELFDVLVCSWPVKNFIMSGWLADYTYISVSPDSEMFERLTRLKKRGVDGDYQTKEMASIMDNRPSIEQLYSSYKKYADGRQGIIYAINREHASHIRDYYEEKGESIMLIDSRTPLKKRDKLMEAYRKGEIRIFVNCEIAGEGVDVPNVSFIQMARPTLSLNKYLQQVGRGLRPNTDGDIRTVILDNVGMYYLFGLPNEDRDWQTMFRVGQILPSEERRKYMLDQLSRKHEMDVDDGHNLQMICLSQQTSAISIGKRSTLEIIPQKGFTNRYNIFLNGVPFLPFDVDVEGPIDGVVGVWECRDRGYHESFYTEEGKEIFHCNDSGSKLFPGGFIRFKAGGGLYKYYDYLLDELAGAYPIYKNVGKASFIRESDGWHLRNENFGHLVVVENSIREHENVVSLCFTEQPTTKYFVFGRNKTVLRLLGFEDDSTEVFCNDLLPDTLFLRKDDRIVALRKDESTKAQFSKWEHILDNGKKVSSPPKYYKHQFESNSKDFYIFEENGLWGWKEGGEVLCSPKFKKVRTYNSGQLLVDIDLPEGEKARGGRDYKSIIVDKSGNTVYDEFHVVSLYEQELKVIRPGLLHKYDVSIKNGIKEYEFTDPKTGINTHYIDGYIFRYVKSKKAWTPNNYKRAVVLLNGLFGISNGVFCGHERDIGNSIMAFPEDKDTFYRVKECFEQGKLLEEIITKRLFIYKDKKLTPINSVEECLAIFRPELVKGQM